MNMKTSWVVQLELLITAWLTWTWKRTEKKTTPKHTYKEKDTQRERERVQLPNTANSKGKMQLN